MALLRDRWFAWLLRRVSGHHDKMLESRKRELLGNVSGTVVEVGPGTGANLRYFPKGIRWIGIEPNQCMHADLRAEAAEVNMKIELRGGGVEAMELADASVDCVVATLLLCSVTDAAYCVAEMRRILKPGGRFVFIEHVAAPPGSRLLRVQQLITPLWGLIGGGCDPARCTGSVLRNAGFHSIEIEEFNLPAGPAAPHIAGVAIR